jgi:SAM-dependent methyltransferase
LIKPGGRVLDLACGTGRHSLAAAELGATVLAVDRDPARLAEARRRAQREAARITWLELDLEQPWPDFGTFDAVLLFNYLDRTRMEQVLACVAPGGLLLMETFLEAQRTLGWGPTSERHLLRSMELPRLVHPLEVLHAREVFQPADASRWSWVASVVARKEGT